MVWHVIGLGVRRIEEHDLVLVKTVIEQKLPLCVLLHQTDASSPEHIKSHEDQYRKYAADLKLDLSKVTFFATSIKGKAKDRFECVYSGLKLHNTTSSE